MARNFLNELVNPPNLEGLISMVEHYTCDGLKSIVDSFDSGDDRQRNEGKLLEELKKLAEEEVDLDLTTLLEDMNKFTTKAKELETGNYSTRNRFSTYFQDTLLGAYYRYRTTKHKAWSAREILLVSCRPLLVAVLIAGGSSLLEALFSVAFFSVDMGDSKVFHFTGILLSAGVTAAFLFLVGLAFLYAISTMRENRSYRETWVRHSAAYGRLRLALSRFLLSEQKTEDLQELEERTFSILEQDYDQFVANLSGHGMTKHSGTEKRT